MEPVIDGLTRWFVLPVNPEPWAVGPLSVGRRGGKVFASMGRNAQLDAYKQTIAEALGDGHEIIEGKVKIRFYFWRQRANYTTPQGRSHRKHEADVTNMQKATEDALQGILFKNDKDTNDVHSIVVEQGPDVIGKVVLSVEPNTSSPAIQIPNDVWMLLEQIDNPATFVHLPTLPDDNDWPPKGAHF